MTGPEFGLEDPELQVPNRLRISNSKLWRRLKFSNNVDAFGGIMLSAAKTSRINAFEKNKEILSSAQHGNWVLELLWMLKLGFGA